MIDCCKISISVYIYIKSSFTDWNYTCCVVSYFAGAAGDDDDAASTSSGGVYVTPFTMYP